MTAKSFLDQHPQPARAEIEEAVSGNLCRCTGYIKIVDAIETMAKGANHQRNVHGKSYGNPDAQQSFPR